MTERTLTDLEKQIIDFAADLGERKLTDRGVYNRLIASFAWRPITFQQRLNALLDDPAAERERPMAVRRLRRIRDARRAARLTPAVSAG